jgi:hypothetical protein
MFPRSSTGRRTTVATRIKQNWRHSSQELSDKPGAVHLLLVMKACVGWGDPSRMDTGLREGGRTASCEHLQPQKAGRSVPFHGIVNDALPYGLAQ